VEPIDVFAFADGVGEAVEGIAGNSVDSFYAGFDQGLDKYFGYGFRHMEVSLHLELRCILDATERFDSRLERRDFGFFSRGCRAVAFRSRKAFPREVRETADPSPRLGMTNRRGLL
jgi:hypothetical protein